MQVHAVASLKVIHCDVDCKIWLEEAFPDLEQPIYKHHFEGIWTDALWINISHDFFILKHSEVEFCWGYISFMD